ncbi:MAG: DUF4129 domain-containing protein [Janthinobacterium lividum]
MRNFLIILLWLLVAATTLTIAAPAQPAPVAASPAPAVQLRQPAAATVRLDELRGQREFRYVAPKPSAPNLWQRLWQSFWKWVDEKLEGTTYNGFWRWIFYVVLAGALIFVVLKLLQVDLTAAFGRSPRKAGSLDYDATTENIHELDFAVRLHEAEDTGNYRLALRLGYLELLKNLTDQNLIDWQPNKTNHSYLRELADVRPATRPAFSELTRQFEYVWYGELPLPAPLYRHAREAQLQFGRQLRG